MARTRARSRAALTRRRLVGLLAGAVAVGLIAAGLSAGLAPRTAPAAAPAHSASVEADPAGSPDDPYRPAFHITPERDWMNDPQRPFYLDGRWHLYYLHNADYPDGNGTEWYHLTSTDLVNWTEEGVAIEKYRNGLGDIETGSAVVDTHNTAGFGHGAVVAVLTQQHEGVQRQSLFYSTDGGYTFRNHSGNPVMDNPREPHWRDPKIIRDEAHDQWVMVLAEGHRLGFYTSRDLKSWKYASDFAQPGLGLLECPDLFQLDLDADPGRRTWVLAASANGHGEGMTTGVVYWTGEWDGERFLTESDHQWMDNGSDFYAAVTWEDPRRPETERTASRHALGWMNNWAYAEKLPTRAWQGGAQSVVRDIRLRTVDGRPTLVSAPLPALGTLEEQPIELGERKITERGTTGLPPMAAPYRLDVDVARREGDRGSEFRLRLGGDADGYITVGYDFVREQAFVVRDRDAASGNAGSVYREPRVAPVPPRDGVIHLTVLVDRSSVEVFVNNGERALTAVTFPTPDAELLEAVSVDGELTLLGLRLAPLRDAG